MSLLKKILTAICLITMLLLLYVWFIIRPKYEKSVLDEHLAAAEQLQKSSIDNLDVIFAEWSHIPRFLISKISERPNEGESILRITMALHPEIFQIRIHSSGPLDELVSRDTSYPLFNIQIPDSIWENSKADSALKIAWITDNEKPNPILVMQMHFQVQQSPFNLTVYWNADRIKNIVSGLSIDPDYSFSLRSSSGIIAQNLTELKPDISPASYDSNKVIWEKNKSWLYLIKPLRTLKLSMTAAVSENTVIKQRENFILYSGSLIVGPMLILAALGCLLSFQIKRFLQKLKPTSVEE